MTEEEVKEITRAETTSSLLLWLGVLGAPLAWSVQVFVVPDLAEVICYAGAESQGQVYGLALESFLMLVSLVLAAVAALALLVSISCWRKLSGADEVAPAGRAQWMALAGVLTSVLFLAGILLNFFPFLFLNACEVAL